MAPRRCRPPSASIRPATRPLAQGRQEPVASTSCCRSGLPSSGRAFLLAGVREAVIRALLYVGMARGAVDERGVRGGPPHSRKRTSDDYRCRNSRALVREQFYMLLIDEEAALAAIPSMLPADAEARQQALRPRQEITERTRCTVSAKTTSALQRVARLFGLEERRPSSKARVASSDAASGEGSRRPDSQSARGGSA